MNTSCHAFQVVEVEFNDCDEALRILGSPVGAAERFNRLAWGSPGDGSLKVPLPHLLACACFY